MTPEVKRQWKDTLARLRAERDQFRARSTARRKDMARLRKQRRFLEALEAMTRMHEYANTARQYQAEIDKIKPMLASKK